MKIKIFFVVLAAISAFFLAGCAEKVDTNIEKVNEGKGERIEVTPRNREGEGSGR